MKRLLENWRGYLNEQEEEEASTSFKDKALGAAAKAKSAVVGKAKGIAKDIESWDKDRYCKAYFDLWFEAKDIETFGELRALLQCTVGYDKKK